jgi:hypothetical protein
MDESFSSWDSHCRRKFNCGDGHQSVRHAANRLANKFHRYVNYLTIDDQKDFSTLGGFIHRYTIFDYFGLIL